MTGQGPGIAVRPGMFFHSWGAIGHVVLATSLVYIFIVGALRIVGAQSLAKMSGYDMVTTITLGSVIATVAVTRDITLSEGAAALITLLLLQEVVRHLQSRFVAIHHIVREPPLLVLWDGHLLEDELRKGRVSADEVRAAVRRSGFLAIEQVQAVVLENDGDWSVIPKNQHVADWTALHGIALPGAPTERGETSGRPASPERVP